MNSADATISNTCGGVYEDFVQIGHKRCRNCSREINIATGEVTFRGFPEEDMTDLPNDSVLREYLKNTYRQNIALTKSRHFTCPLPDCQHPAAYSFDGKLTVTSAFDIHPALATLAQMAAQNPPVPAVGAICTNPNGMCTRRFANVGGGRGRGAQGQGQGSRKCPSCLRTVNIATGAYTHLGEDMSDVPNEAQMITFLKKSFFENKIRASSFSIIERNCIQCQHPRVYYLGDRPIPSYDRKMQKGHIYRCARSDGAVCTKWWYYAESKEHKFPATSSSSDK